MSVKKLSSVLFPAVTTCFLFNISAVYAEAPFIDPANDEKHFASPDNTLFWTPEQQVAGYRNSDKITWTRRVESGKSVRTLPYAKVDLGDVEIQGEDASNIENL